MCNISGTNAFNFLDIKTKFIALIIRLFLIAFLIYLCFFLKKKSKKYIKLFYTFSTVIIYDVTVIIYKKKTNIKVFFMTVFITVDDESIYLTVIQIFNCSNLFENKLLFFFKNYNSLFRLIFDQPKNNYEP